MPIPPCSRPSPTRLPLARPPGSPGSEPSRQDRAWRAGAATLAPASASTSPRRTCPRSNPARPSATPSPDSGVGVAVSFLMANGGVGGSFDWRALMSGIGAAMTFVAERRRGNFGNSSPARTHAQSRAEIEPHTRAGAFIWPDSDFLLRQLRAEVRTLHTPTVPYALRLPFNMNRCIPGLRRTAPRPNVPADTANLTFRAPYPSPRP